MTDWTYKPYTALVGPRTPEAAVWVLRNLATKLALTGWTLRASEHASDRALVEGAADAGPGMPYDPGTRRRRVPVVELYGDNDVNRLRGAPEGSDERNDFLQLARAAREAHPAWDDTDTGARLRHVAGLFRLFGEYPQGAPVPVHFVIYWHDGAGDTAQVVRYVERWNRGDYGLWGTPDANSMSDDHQIQLRNLHDPEWLERALAKLEVTPADYRAQWGLDGAYAPTAASQGAWPAPAGTDTAAS